MDDGVAKRETETQRAMNELHKARQGLVDTATTLQGRLRKVLRPEEDHPERAVDEYAEGDDRETRDFKNSTELAFSTSLAAEIGEVSGQINALNRKLRATIERLEV